MRHKMPGEALAKAGIYLLSSVMLFVAIFFWQDARGFMAAAAEDAQASTPTRGPAAPSGGGVALPDASEAVPPAVAPQLKTPVPPEMLPGLWNPPLPGTGEDALLPDERQAMLPDAGALQAEVDRLLAMDVGFPGEIDAQFVGDFHATAYCCEVYPHICGGNGVTASGTVPTPGLTCAADWKVLPPGTWLYIEDVGIRRVEDSGSAILGARLDIAVDTHENALRWLGFGGHRVWVLWWGV